MAEFIGARISLVSKSDIRYVGTLHEINSETSTVALENVSMLGTEGRRPDNEVAALDSIYEYILFRGTDVKDLRIEEAPSVKNKTPQIPNDPAILGSGSRPVPQIRSSNQLPTSSTYNHGQQILTSSQSTSVLPQTGGASYGQHSQYQQFYPHPTGWGRGAPPGHAGYTTVPYAGPPVWYPGPQHSFSPSTQFTPYGYPTVQSGIIAQQHSTSSGKSIPSGVIVNKTSATSTQQSKRASESKIQPKAAEIPAATAQKIPSPPTSSKPSLNEINVAVSLTASKQESTTISDVVKPISTESKTANRIKPALPLRNISINKEVLPSSSGNLATQRSIDSPAVLRKATQAASDAISKLSLTGVNGISTDDKRHIESVRNTRHLNRSNFSSERLNRGNHRTHSSKSGAHRATPKVEVPTEDFDFESANAKFNKEDLIREASAGSPVIKGGSHQRSVEKETTITYNKATSFFDNISSEVKDRQEAGNSRPGGREWRGEELKKNLETFGQESIDNGHRGGYRSRGRGRGGYRGRGYNRNVHSSRGRPEHQNLSDAQAVS